MIRGRRFNFLKLYCRRGLFVVVVTVVVTVVVVVVVVILFPVVAGVFFLFVPSLLVLVSGVGVTVRVNRLDCFRHGL
jgi:hypothetical protein